MATVVAGKYELLEVLRDAGIRSYRARQVTLGHVLMVHFIRPSQHGDDYALLDRLAQLPEAARKLFFDAGEHDSLLYVVSWPLPDFDSLPDWLDRTIRNSRRQSATAAAAPKTQPADSSEFTRLFFKGMKEPAVSGAGDLVAGQSPSPPRVKEPPLAPKEPGEFTQFFQVPAKVAAPVQRALEPLPPPPAKPPAPLSSGPGEFTQFFQQGAPAPPHPAPAAETEFLPPAPLFPTEDRSPTAPVGRPHSGPPPPLPKPPAALPNAIQAQTVVIPAVPKPPAAAVSPEPPVADDYANVITRPSAPPSPPPPPVAAPRKPAASVPPLPQIQGPPSSPYLPMWITLAVLFVVAVVLTLVLALNR